MAFFVLSSLLLDFASNRMSFNAFESGNALFFSSLFYSTVLNRVLNFFSLSLFLLVKLNAFLHLEQWSRVNLFHEHFAREQFSD